MINRRSILGMVKEFHEYAGHPIAPDPKFPTGKEHFFRADFMKEEATEATLAFAAESLVEYADSLGDLQYVLDGWFLVSGLWKKKREIMEEIHRSNMTKFCKTIEEAEATIDKLVSEDMKVLFGEGLKNANPSLIEQRRITGYHYEEIGELFVVKRHDGKVMKGINYEPPKLEEIIYGRRKGEDKI